MGNVDNMVAKFLKVDLDILVHKAHGNIKGLGEEKWSQSNC